jgi:hypothetical protein
MIMDNRIAARWVAVETRAASAYLPEATSL